MGTEWTVERVIEEAAKKGGWFRTRLNDIRRQRGPHHQCPVSCLGNKPAWDVYEVAEELGIPGPIVDDISQAADDWGDDVIRQAMLSAFDLQEEEG